MRHHKMSYRLLVGRAGERRTTRPKGHGQYKILHPEFREFPFHALR